jgi:hypothetical protein
LTFLKQDVCLITRDEKTKNAQFFYTSFITPNSLVIQNFIPTFNGQAILRLCLKHY